MNVPVDSLPDSQRKQRASVEQQAVARSELVAAEDRADRNARIAKVFMGIVLFTIIVEMVPRIYRFVYPSPSEQCEGCESCADVKRLYEESVENETKWFYLATVTLLGSIVAGVGLFWRSYNQNQKMQQNPNV